MAANAAAYQQLKPIQNTVGQDMKYWAEADFRRKQQEAINAEKKANQLAQEEKERQARLEKYVPKIKNYDTKITSLNELNARIISGAINEIGEVASKLEEDYRLHNLSDEERFKLKTKLNNLQNIDTYMQEFTSNLTNRYVEVETMYKNGQIKDDENYRKFKETYEKGFQNFDWVIDDNGLPGIVYRDIDGDGFKDAEGYETISNGISAFKFTKNVDIENLADTIANRQGVFENETQEGFTTIKTKDVKDPEALESDIYSSLIKKDGTLTDAGKSFMYDLGLEDSLKNRDILVEELRKKVNSRLDKTKSVTTDFSAQTSRMRENRLSSENNTTSGSNEKVPIRKDIWGGTYYNNIDTSKVNSVSGGGIVLEAPKDYKGNIYNNAKVLNYTIDKFGSLLLDIEYIDKSKEVKKTSNRLGTESTTKTTENKPSRKVIQVSLEDAREFAEKKGMTLEELKKSVLKNPEGKRIYKGVDENGNPIFE